MPERVLRKRRSPSNGGGTDLENVINAGGAAPSSSPTMPNGTTPRSAATKQVTDSVSPRHAKEKKGLLHRGRDAAEDAHEGGTAPKKAGPASSGTSDLVEGTTRLGELLVRDNAIDPDELALALADQAASGRRLGQLLLSRGLVSDTALASALAEQLGLPLADLGQADLDRSVAALLPENVARAAQAIPLGDTEGLVEVALADPTDEARAAHVQGTVRLAVLVTEDGSVSSSIVFVGIGYGLDDEALKAARARKSARMLAMLRCGPHAGWGRSW